MTAQDWGGSGVGGDGPFFSVVGVSTGASRILSSASSRSRAQKTLDCR
jgi:hypothetical protein